MLSALRIRLAGMVAVFSVIVLAFRAGYQAFPPIEVYVRVSLQTALPLGTTLKTCRVARMFGQSMHKTDCGRRTIGELAGLFRGGEPAGPCGEGRLRVQRSEYRKECDSRPSGLGP